MTSTSHRTFLPLLLFGCILSCQLSSQAEAFGIPLRSVPFRVADSIFREEAFQVIEKQKTYKIIAVVPGVSADGASVNFTDDGEFRLSATDASGQQVFSKTVNLGSDANSSTATSSCVDGIFEVSVDKKQTPSPIVIDVQAAEPPLVGEGDTEERTVWNVPGVRPNEVNVTIETNLKLGTNVLRFNATSALGYGQYLQAFTLSEDSVPENATAFCSNGLLHIRVPRAQPPEPVDIPVKDSDSDVSVSPTSTSDDEVELTKIHIPGYSAKDVHMTATHGLLMLKVEKKNGGTVERYLALPADLEDLGSLSSMCVDGVLHIRYARSGLRERSETAVKVTATRLPEQESDSDDESVVRTGRNGMIGRGRPVPLRESRALRTGHMMSPLAMVKQFEDLMNFW